MTHMRSSPQHRPCSTARVVQIAQRLLGRATSGDRHPARPGAHRRRSVSDRNSVVVESGSAEPGGRNYRSDGYLALLTGRAVGRGAGDTGAVPYDPTIYLGSAAHYRYGRPAYSPELEAVLTQETGLDGTGRLLDAAAVLACLPSASLTYLSRRSAWTLTPACLRRAAVPPGKWGHEHPVGPGPGRGPACCRARALQAGDLRPVLPLDRRAARGRDRLRHAGAGRRAGTDRPHGDGAAPAARPWSACDPAR